jgi:type I restriction enzyme S subunit
MKAGWEVRQLSDIANVKGGKRVPKGYKLETEPTDHPYLTVSSFTDDGTIDTSELRYLSPEVFAQIARYTVSSNDLFVSIAGTIGKAGSVPPELDGANLTENACKLVFKPGICRDFIYYFTKSHDFALQAAANTRVAAQPKLALERLGTIALAVPDLAEQRRIVGILDEAFDGIATAKANAEKNLQNARALFESHLQTVFTHRGEGWEQKLLASLCDPTRVITYGVILLGGDVPGGVPCLRTSNVRWLRIDTEGIKRIAPSLSAEFGRTVLRGGEVLVNVRGTLGGVSVATPEMAGWNVSREVAVVPVEVSRINPEFVAYWIGAGVSQHWLGGVKKGAAYVGINIEDLRLLPVKVPGPAKQLDIVRHLASMQTETHRLESIYRQKLAALDALKKSLLDRAFTGVL